MIAAVGKRYNLGAEKIRNWLAQDPGRGEGKVFISAIFTWDLPEVAQQANIYKQDYQVEIGGPAPSMMPEWVYDQTGIRPQIGPDERFDQQPGQYEYTFTSRGCPRKCEYCAVPRIEPVRVEYDDFPIAPVIGDNNLVATSWEHQELVVNKLVNFGHEIDIQSGFDVQLFQERHFHLYNRLRLKTWRFAFDRPDQEPDLTRCIQMVKELGGITNRHKVTVYVLVNNGETPDEARRRTRVVYDLGALPFVMIFRPLDERSLVNRRWVSPGWTRQQLRDFAGGINNSRYWRRG